MKPDENNPNAPGAAPSEGEPTPAAQPHRTPQEPEPVEYNLDAESEFKQRLAQLEGELMEANQRYLRSLADFQNFQKRASVNEQVARQSGISSVVTHVASVIDHFDLALNQDTSKASAQQIVDGVKVIREELLRALQRVGVQIINPLPNDDFHPGTHEAITQMTAEGVEPGRIARTFQPGFAIGERLIRPAKVAVAP
jgi:molecular chaperone GrpE